MADPTKILHRPDQKLLYDWLIAHLGLPYFWGGDDPIKGFDCSGLAIEMLITWGIIPPSYDTNAHGLYTMFKDSASRAGGIGSLIFFGKESKVTHVGIALNGWQMIEAGGGGRSTTSEEIASVQNAYVRLRPICSRKDYVATVWPFLHTFGF
jgi:cell wall-associated NlpC family hydrolase